MLGRIKLLAQISLLFVLLVVIAGSVVRMTGSGMGCPDWPKCFGYYIPPTEEAQVLWAPNKVVNSGEMIVYDQALWKAKKTFTTGQTIDLTNWEKYDKHDYAIFNVAHTWTEYVNRLVGATTGIPVLLLFVFSIGYGIRQKKWRAFGLSSAVLFFLGFEAWLGKKVVDGNLIPGHISMHMIGSIVLIILLLFIIKYASQPSEIPRFPARLKWWFAGLVVLSGIQIILGTQVREEVDLLIKAGTGRDGIIDGLPSLFKVHRSFSILMVLMHVWVFYQLQKMGQLTFWPRILAGILLVEIAAGIILAYADMPAAFQPVHLTCALLMIGVQTHLLLRAQGKKSELKTSI